MPKSRKTASSATVTKSAIDHATSILEDLPEKPKENWSLREAVAYLQAQISSALSKGYSYEEVARMLTERGIEISASSLKSYLSAAKRQKDATPKAGRTGRKSRKTLSDKTTLTETATPAAVNGTAAKAGESLNGAKQESAAPETADNPAPKKRRTRSSEGAKPPEKTAAKSTRSTTAKTAAKSKSAPRTKSKTETATPAKRGRRQKKA
ncbi:hypothetical protein [Leptolyngbya ohadii]|uniref:hypothetical protein n=1 Tax=Leptolyngbya ohadii TaxID=1962290 RepID=UPI000B59DF3B|nr:hypothetical protein [Leptolyngbya ohadii]